MQPCGRRRGRPPPTTRTHTAAENKKRVGIPTTVGATLTVNINILLYAQSHTRIFFCCCWYFNCYFYWLIRTLENQLGQDGKLALWKIYKLIIKTKEPLLFAIERQAKWIQLWYFIMTNNCVVLLLLYLFMSVQMIIFIFKIFFKPPLGGACCLRYYRYYLLMLFQGHIPASHHHGERNL